MNDYCPVSLSHPSLVKCLREYLTIPPHILKTSLNPNQSGFKPNDSCVYQLLQITNSISSIFYSNLTLETSYFGIRYFRYSIKDLNNLDISKGFDKVWHKSLIFKPQPLGLLGNLLDLMKRFLSERYQRVLLNTQSSE